MAQPQMQLLLHCFPQVLVQNHDSQSKLAMKLALKQWKETTTTSMAAEERLQIINTQSTARATSTYNASSAVIGTPCVGHLAWQPQDLFLLIM
jgi:hypothetical protein